MVNKPDSNKARVRKHMRVRGKISGTAERPRLNVFRSNSNIYAQLIDDVKGVTLASASSLEKDFGEAKGNCEEARKVGVQAVDRGGGEEEAHGKHQGFGLHGGGTHRNGDGGNQGGVADDGTDGVAVGNFTMAADG